MSRTTAPDSAARMTNLPKNAKVLLYLAQRCGRPLGATKHLKLAYLADLISRQYRGKSITRFRYISYDRGPFDSAFYAAREQLVGAGLGTETYRRLSANVYERLFRPSDEETDLDLEPGERQVLDYVCDRFGRMTLPKLLRIVYDTPPMKEAERQGDLLPMESVNNSEADRLGMDLDELAAAEERVRGGVYLSFDTFSREVRAAVHARTA